MYNPKSAKNLETFPPKFQTPDASHTDPNPSDSSKSQFEEEKKEGIGFANYSFFKAQSEHSNSSSRNSSQGHAIDYNLSREPSED